MKFYATNHRQSYTLTRSTRLMPRLRQESSTSVEDGDEAAHTMLLHPHGKIKIATKSSNSSAEHATTTTTMTVNNNHSKNNYNHERADCETATSRSRLDKAVGLSPDLFELLEKAQSSRLNDQRCVLPQQERKEEIVNDNCRTLTNNNEGDDPRIDDRRRRIPALVALSPGYWIDDGGGGGAEAGSRKSARVGRSESGGSRASCESGCEEPSAWRFDVDDSATAYRKYFYGKDHLNFTCYHPSQGPVALSIKFEKIFDKSYTRVIFRSKTKSNHQIFSSADVSSLDRLGQLLLADHHPQQWQPVYGVDVDLSMLTFDNHFLQQYFKFGVVIQRRNQTQEEEIFSNENCADFESFLENLGSRIELKSHRGFRGGLDCQHGTTGAVAIYEKCDDLDVEIIYHVATFMPLMAGHDVILNRKRHIGNDIVAIVYQEQDDADSSTLFRPELVESGFLHVFIVVRRMKDDGHSSAGYSYKVTVMAREDVPHFGPPLPANGIFRDLAIFRRFLRLKLLNAEIAALRAGKFAQLEKRTRSALLSTLCDDLERKTIAYHGGKAGKADKPKDGQLASESSSNSGSKFIDSVRKAFGGKFKMTGNQHDVSKTDGASFAPSIATMRKSWDISSESTTPTRRFFDKEQHASIASRRSLSSINDTLSDFDISSSTSFNSSVTTPLSYHGEPDGAATPNALAMDADKNSDNSDTGLESMECSVCCYQQEEARLGANVNNGVAIPQLLREKDVDRDDFIRGMDMEIKRLKCDKLELLRDNVNCQRDLKRMKENEMQRENELALAAKEIARLRALIKDYELNESK